MSFGSWHLVAIYLALRYAFLRSFCSWKFSRDENLSLSCGLRCLDREDLANREKPMKSIVYQRFLRHCPNKRVWAPFIFLPLMNNWVDRKSMEMLQSVSNKLNFELRNNQNSFCKTKVSWTWPIGKNETRCLAAFCSSTWILWKLVLITLWNFTCSKMR